MPDPQCITITLPRPYALCLLHDFASEISEQCWCAQWIDGLEDTLPQLCKKVLQTGEAQPYGQGVVTVQDATILQGMVEGLGGWEALQEEVEED